MSLEDWQIGLRRQFGREQKFSLKNTGGQPIFSEFEVGNPESKNTYRVAIRGLRPGDNFCSCPDYATNTLATCKHIQFTLAKLQRKTGGRAALKQGYRPPYSSVSLRYGVLREVQFRPGRKCSLELRRLAAAYFGPDGTLRPAAFPKFEAFLSKAARIEPDLRCYEDVLSFIAEVRDADRRVERLTAVFPKGIRSAAFDGLLRLPLYDYQREAVLAACRAGRALLGDEMGLGKTIQAIATAEVMAREFGVERVLVICPTSLKHQWEREIVRCTDRAVLVIGGLARLRSEQFGTESFYKITNYDTVHRDLGLIKSWSPDLVILDEAQRIKNWKTRTARGVKKVSSPYALVLTGTPIENRLEELLSIVQFIDRHRLGPTFRFLSEHQVLDEFGRVVGYRQLDRIGKTLEPILIRRRKAQVLDQLPERLEKNFFVPMTREQMDHHEENRETVARIVAKWRRYRFLSDADQRRLMIALQNMRMACDSTYLLDGKTDFGLKVDELVTLFEEVSERPNTKVVIFSQWLRMHELITERLTKRGWSHVFFHGGVPEMDRKTLVDRFREDPRCVGFLSTDAGGVGLNLQGATVVVNMDLPWNPAVLEQRIGRVHRLGQSRAVQVINFVAKGTIEEGMLSLLAFKSSLFAGVLDGGEKEVFLGGSRLSRFIKSVEKVTADIPKPEVEVKDSASSRKPTVGLASASAGGQAEQSTGEPTTSSDPLANLLRGGLDLLEGFAAAMRTRPERPPDNDRGAGGETPSFLKTLRDEKTGQTYVKLPVPDPTSLDRALKAFRTIFENL